MSLWHTLHLLHYPTFEIEVLDRLRLGGPKLDIALRAYFEACEPLMVRGKSVEEVEVLLRSAATEIQVLSEGFDTSFRKHKIYNTLPDWRAQREYVDSLDWAYDFSKFFEWLVFRYAADFFPHIAMGKRSLSHHLTIRKDCVAAQVLDQFGDRNSLLCADDRGIIQWLTPAETEILFLDKDLLTAEDSEFRDTVQQFMHLAVEHGLGLIQGLEMAETQLEKLPAYKIVPEAAWKDFRSPYLLFER